METQNVVIAVTGASGVLTALKCLSLLKPLSHVTTHLVVTDAAKKVFAHELPEVDASSLKALADTTYDPKDVGARIASGSYPTAGMVITPCSLHTAMALSSGLATNLVERAGQVHLKERRPLVICLRESPLAPLHLGNLERLALSGATIMPLAPRFYLFPESVDRMVEDMALKALGPLRIVGLPQRYYDPSQN